MPYCLVFPGQGTQFPGMLQGLPPDCCPDEALLALMQTGPVDELYQTVNAQPAVLTVSAALLERASLDEPALVMGHSLGEYTALVAAGCLERDAAVELVRQRAIFMEQAGKENPGAMGAVLGLDLDGVQAVIGGMEDIWVANINTPQQVVVSGKAAALEKAIPLLKEQGARRLVPLKVSVASHCPLMESAAVRLRDYLEGVAIRPPRCPVVFNAAARPANDPAEIRDLLVKQLTGPVRWTDSVGYCLDEGVDLFYEIGPRSVLAGLIKKIAPQAAIETRTVK